jgi:hypothetical protein
MSIVLSATFVRPTSVYQLRTRMRGSPLSPKDTFSARNFQTERLLRGRRFVGDFVAKGLTALVLRLLTPNQPIDVVVEICWVLTYITASTEEWRWAARIWWCSCWRRRPATRSC